MADSEGSMRRAGGIPEPCAPRALETAKKRALVISAWDVEVQDMRMRLAGQIPCVFNMAMDTQYVCGGWWLVCNNCNREFIFMSRSFLPEMATFRALWPWQQFWPWQYSRPLAPAADLLVRVPGSSS